MDEFKQLYTKYEKQIYKYLFYLSRDKFIAEELTQETFFQVLTSIHRFKGHSKISTWLYQIAKYTFFNYLKKNEKVEPVADLNSFQKENSNQETPENIYEKKEESIHVLHALKKLKPSQQEIIILRFYNELSFKEIGEIFNQSDTWARVNFYRAKNKLSAIMYGGEEV
ncbi:sigma-70 family RNA polymerase sigma factor [Ornithinibacillus sp. L9]|uniref:Sigma-70 family RNA polymerase sigma factor n=1 Tax=Ornithinibacillus caprae TaxID=2678566 RepID=A0A6N8FR30_9BACI|nr:RNA polymerase sigma factor [Ornithinibacillus caprae]MUK90639.1 sigma-70 family RNA polymerase sigma factor [Ornithinibacillus caprae]